MKKNLRLLIAAFVLTGVGIFLASCSPDDDPKKPIVSFSSDSKTVQESDGDIEVKVVLDRPASTDIVVSYELSGTATEKGGINQGDYEITDDEEGEVTIPKGETIGTINLNIVNDATFELDETIEITLIDFSSGAAGLGDVSVTEITIQSDDVAPKASFAVTSLTVNEFDGTEGLLELTINLDAPAPQNLDIEYEISGSAIDSVSGFNEDIPGEYYDYYIDGESGKATVASGESSTTIKIQLLSDFHYESVDETMIFTLKAGSSIQLGTNKTMTVTLKQQNGKAIALLWNDPTYTDVDMDMFLWVGSSVESLNGILATSLNPSVTTKQEVLFIPSGIFENAAFGLSYVYYSGTANPLNFKVHFADYTNGVLEGTADRDIFDGSYTLANINPWDHPTNGTDPQVEQTFTIDDGVLGNISGITVPTSGSRARTYQIPAKTIKNTRSLLGGKFK